MLNSSFCSAPIQSVRNHLPFCLYQFYITLNRCSHPSVLFYMDLSQKLGLLWVYTWQAQNIHGAKISFTLQRAISECPQAQVHKNVPCKTSHPSFMSFHSQTAPVCPVMDLKAPLWSGKAAPEERVPWADWPELTWWLVLPFNCGSS